jgi:nondiscriminating glutamyl-tRNA synthetase
VIRTRFAPSPTGSLHVGNARIAVLNWLLTRRHGGAFILRIEDTDVERNVPGSEAQIGEDLRWLGLDWDEGPALGAAPALGDAGPYRQSERGELYRERAEWLRTAGRVYPCWCTPDELAARRTAAIEASRPTQYDRRCLHLPAETRARFDAEGRRPALRLHGIEGGEVTVRDEIRGEIRFPAADIGDFIVLRADGEPTYNFAVVVDDIAMRITHVIRGAGHLSNTPRQALLFDAFGAARPLFAHVPTVLGPDRQKLSKRHGAQALADYRAEGYHPDALVNYLSLLAWSSPSGEEVLTRDRLVAETSLDRVGAADVVFDGTKLRWLSARHIERMELPALVEAVRPFLPPMPAIPEAVLPTAVAAVRSHLETFMDIAGQVAGFFPSAAGAGAAAPAEGEQPVLRAVHAALEGLDVWDEAAVAQAVRAGGAASGVKGRALFGALRLALTGREHGPPLPAVIVVQGRDQVLARLREPVRG